MTPKLCIPVEVLNQHVCWLGKTRAGKSSAMRHVVEYLLGQKKRVCVIDPKGDWYGLRAAGKGPGFEVVLFGDFKDNVKSDVPLIPRSQLDNAEFDTSVAAKHVAQLVTSGNRPCVIGMRGWTSAAMVRFWVDFASTVFSKESGELYLVIDEVHNFAPKGQLKGREGSITKALHWTNRLLNEGAGIGIINLIASQRPQKVHNDSLTACETLVAMRVVHKADRDAITDWIKGCGDQNITAESLKLADQARGQGVVWSPEIGFGPERVQFPMFQTFDSFAPQRLQKKKLNQKGWASVDLTEVREKLSRVIEEAKAEDPAELHKTIADQSRQIVDLTRQAEAKPAAAPAKAAPAKVKKVNVIEDRHVERLEKTLCVSEELVLKRWRAIEAQFDRQRAALADLRDLLQKAQPASAEIAPPVAESAQTERVVSEPPIRSPRPADSNGDESGDLSKMQRTMLIVLAQHPEGLTKAQVLLHAGYAASGGTSKAFAGLLKRGFAEKPEDKMLATRPGLSAIAGFKPLPQGAALREYLLTGDKLNTMEKNILRVACDSNPSALKKSEVLILAEYQPSGGTSKAFARLLRYGYLTSAGKTHIRASEVLFD